MHTFWQEAEGRKPRPRTHRRTHSMSWFIPPWVIREWGKTVFALQHSCCSSPRACEGKWNDFVVVWAKQGVVGHPTIFFPHFPKSSQFQLCSKTKSFTLVSLVNKGEMMVTSWSSWEGEVTTWSQMGVEDADPSPTLPSIHALSSLPPQQRGTPATDNMVVILNKLQSLIKWL